MTTLPDKFARFIGSQKRLQDFMKGSIGLARLDIYRTMSSNHGDPYELEAHGMTENGEMASSIIFYPIYGLCVSELDNTTDINTLHKRFAKAPPEHNSYIEIFDTALFTQKIQDALSKSELCPVIGTILWNQVDYVDYATEMPLISDDHETYLSIIQKTNYKRDHGNLIPGLGGHPSLSAVEDRQLPIKIDYSIEREWRLFFDFRYSDANQKLRDLISIDEDQLRYKVATSSGFSDWEDYENTAKEAPHLMNPEQEIKQFRRERESLKEYLTIEIERMDECARVVKMPRCHCSMRSICSYLRETLTQIQK